MAKVITYDAVSNIITCTGGTSGDPITFQNICDANDAGGWGVVDANGTSQFIFSCRLYIGDGGTVTYFTDYDKQIVFTDTSISASGQFWILSQTNATVTFGTLISATYKSTAYGIDFITLNSTYWGRICNTTGLVYFYGCSFSSLSSCLIRGGGVNGRFWNCILRTTTSLESFSTGSDIFNLTAVGAQTATRFFTGVTMDRIIGLGVTYGAYAYNPADGVTIRNLMLRGIVGFAVYIEAASTVANCYLINPDFDAWNFRWLTAPYNATVYRQYTINVTVTNKDGNALSNATVSLVDKNGTSVFSVTTDTNGNIATQTVTRGTYSQATGDSLQDLSPHTLTISKTGYQSYVKKFTLTAQTVWEIKLAKAQPILLDRGEPVLNVQPANPENKLVVKL
jgi:hypothetical protein